MTRLEFVDKVDYEGSIGEALSYFGWNIASEGNFPPEFVQAWAKAWNAVNAVNDMLDEWRTEAELETALEAEVEED